MHDEEEEVDEEVPVADVLEEGVVVSDFDAFFFEVFTGFFVVDNVWG